MAVAQAVLWTVRRFPFLCFATAARGVHVPSEPRRFAVPRASGTAFHRDCIFSVAPQAEATAACTTGNNDVLPQLYHKPVPEQYLNDPELQAIRCKIATDSWRGRHTAAGRAPYAGLCALFVVYWTDGRAHRQRSPCRSGRARDAAPHTTSVRVTAGNVAGVREHTQGCETPSSRISGPLMVQVDGMLPAGIRVLYDHSRGISRARAIIPRGC